MPSREPRARRASRRRPARPRPAAAAAGSPRAGQRRAGGSDPRGGAGGPSRAEPEAACQLRGAHAPRQVQQRQRVAARLRDDAVADTIVEPTRDGSAQQRARILVGQPAQHQLGQAAEVVPGTRLADRDHDRDRLRQQPSRDEAEDQRRGRVEPLGVLHQTQQRPLLGRGGQQAQHGESDQEPVRDVARREAQGDAQRVPLGLRQRVQLVEQRRAELMDARRTAAPSPPPRP